MYAKIKAAAQCLEKSSKNGFTIVETLIVLAVTSALVIAIIGTIGGKQNKTEFTQAVRSIQGEMQSVINEVSSGYYPNDGSFKCEANGTSNVRIFVPNVGGGNEQGTNSGCIFLGKIIQFGVDGDLERYNVYSVAGLRANSVGDAITVLKNAKPRLIAKSNISGDTTPDRFETKKLQYGLSVSKMYYGKVANDATRQIGAMGFISRFGANLVDGNGAQQLDVVAVKNTNLATNREEIVTDINIRLQTNDNDNDKLRINPLDGVHLCLNSGGTEQSARLSIGGDGRQLSVDVTNFSTKDCV